MTGSIILGQRFASKEEIEAAKQRYSLEQGVPYVIFNSTLAKTYNANVVPAKQMPEEMWWKDLIIACKHYGKPRQSAHQEGKQRRNNQSTFKKYCEAKVNISFSIKDKCHIVTKVTESHCNHAQGSMYTRNYPEFRRVSQETEEKVHVLFQNEAKTHRIRDVVLNSGVLATAQDIQNLRNKWLAIFKDKKKSPEEALFEQLRIMKVEEPTSVEAVQYDPDSNMIASVFFQTAFMRQSLEMYPEVLIMDTTYQICDNEMPLVVFSVIDCFGFTRIAGYAFIMCEKKEIVTGAMEGLKMGCSNITDQICVIYVDKAQNEIAAIKETLPKAEVHLCDFHVKNNFQRNKVRKLIVNWKETEPLLNKLIHAHTKEDYDKVYIKLTNVEGGPESEFMKYFNKNWHTGNTDLVWSDYQRNQSVTLGERTTGKVECHNGKIKKMVDKKMPVAQVFMRLRVMNRNSAIEHEHRVFNLVSKTKYHKYSDDPVIQKIMKVNTPFVGDLLKRQYERSLEAPSETIHKVTSEICDCKTFTQYKIICSHIFRERSLKGLEIYDHSMVPGRWTVIIPSSADQSTYKEFQIVAAPIKAPKNPKTMCQEERFLLAESICKRICSLIANYAGNEFHSRICALQNMEDLLRMSKRVAVVGIDAEGQVAKFKSEDDTGEKPFCQKADNSDEVEDHTILASNKDEPKKFFPLTPAVEKILKLPVKCPVPGRPKGSRMKGKQSKRKRQGSDTDTDEIEDVEAVDQVYKCDRCEGPVTCRTSFSKNKYGRKYILCASRKTDLCKAFHAWIDKDPAIQSEKKGDTVLEVHGGKLESNDAPGSEGVLDSSEVSASDPVSQAGEIVSPFTPISSEVSVAKKCFSCNEEAGVYTAGSVANYGRRFYSCKNPVKPACKWINWIDKKPVQAASSSSVSPSTRKVKNLSDFFDKVGVSSEAKTEEIVFRSTSDGFEEDLLKAMDAISTSPLPPVVQYEMTSCSGDSSNNAGVIDKSSEDRRNRGLLIPDEAVHFNSDGNYWQITSSDDENKQYRVDYVFQDKCSCSADFPICHHSLKCSCPDHMFRKITCKHMYKIEHYVCNTGSNDGNRAPQMIEDKINSTCCSVCGGPGGVKATKAHCAICKCVVHPVRCCNHQNQSFHCEVCSWDTPKEFPLVKSQQKCNILNFPFRKSDFKSLETDNYLNDNVIDCFIALASSKTFLANSEAAIHTMSCLALANTDMGLTAYIETAAKEHHLFNDVWIVPSLINRNHWILFIVIIKKKKILILDPLYDILPIDAVKQLQILRYVIEETHKYSFEGKPNWNDWTMHAPTDVHFQKNGSDCGLFVCVWAFCLCTQTKFPFQMSTASTDFRKWISNMLFSRAEFLKEELLDNMSASHSDHDSDIEMISEVYGAIDNNSIATKAKPWQDLKDPVIEPSCPDEREPMQFLLEILSELCTAKGTACGAPTGCRISSNRVMLLCEACREWYHPDCIGDQRRRATAETHYLCPEHSRGKTRTRVTVKPLRHRLSLS